MLNSPAVRIAIGIMGLLVILIGIGFSQPMTRQWMLNSIFSSFYNGRVESAMNKQPLLRSLNNVDRAFYNDVRESIRLYAELGNLKWNEAVPRYRADLTRAAFWRLGQAGDKTLRLWLDNLADVTATLAEKNRPDLCTALIFGTPETESDTLLSDESLTASAKVLVAAFDDPGPSTQPASDEIMARLNTAIVSDFKHRDTWRMKLKGPFEVARPLSDYLNNRAPPALVCHEMRRVLDLIRQLPMRESAAVVRRLMIPSNGMEPSLMVASVSGSRESRIRMTPPPPGEIAPPEPELYGPFKPQPSRVDLPLHKAVPLAKTGNNAAPHDEALAK